MKTLSILCFAMCLSMSVYSQQEIAQPAVDKRVELMSIVYRLVGNEEYNRDENKIYVQKIHQHFDKYKDHPLIKYAQQFRDSLGIGYDAVMEMAVHLSQPPMLSLVAPFNSNEAGERWDSVHAVKFVKLLQQFYKEAHCQSFFDANKYDYTVAQERFGALFKKFDISWYYKFYGLPPKEHFNIIIGLANGGGNYGPHVTTPEGKSVFAIIGSSSFDSAGKPVYEKDYYLPTLIHEFNHSFVNYLTDKHKSRLQTPGTILFEKEEKKMERLMYKQWETMLSEALVRAGVIRYTAVHEPDTKAAEEQMQHEQSIGFVWMPGLVNLLTRYEQERTTYPTLESFMPMVVHFYDTVAPKIDLYEAEYKSHWGNAVSTSPFLNKDMNVSPGVKEILFHFDRKMNRERYTFGPRKGSDKTYPKVSAVQFIDDNTVSIKLELQAKMEYEVNMWGRFMRTSDGYPVNDYTLTFKTGE